MRRAVHGTLRADGGWYQIDFRRLMYNPLVQMAMLPILGNLQWIRLIVNTLGGLGFPGILVDTQIVFALFAWWKH